MELAYKPSRILRMHPQKFALWLFIVTITMLFASLTSAYIVKQSQGEWLIFKLPELFKVTTGLIILSSISMHWAYLSTKRNNLFQIRLALLVTSVIAIAFILGQYQSWSELVSQDIFFIGNAAGSFIYVLTGLHALHILSAIIFLIVMLISAFRYKVHSKSMLNIEMCTTYWHFLGGLWLYLYLFLITNN